MMYSECHEGMIPGTRPISMECSPGDIPGNNSEITTNKNVINIIRMR